MGSEFCRGWQSYTHRKTIRSKAAVRVGISPIVVGLKSVRVVANLLLLEDVSLTAHCDADVFGPTQTILGRDYMIETFLEQSLYSENLLLDEPLHEIRLDTRVQLDIICRLIPSLVGFKWPGSCE